MPAVDKRTGQVISVSGNTAEVMDLETFEVFEVPIPKEIAGRISPGAEVEYWVSMGKKRIVKVISGNTLFF
jgi:translation initiation factor 5A